MSLELKIYNYDYIETNKLLNEIWWLKTEKLFYPNEKYWRVKSIDYIISVYNHETKKYCNLCKCVSYEETSWFSKKINTIIHYDSYFFDFIIEKRYTKDLDLYKSKTWEYVFIDSFIKNIQNTFNEYLIIMNDIKATNYKLSKIFFNAIWFWRIYLTNWEKEIEFYTYEYNENKNLILK
jgi:hypothetical protein